MGFLSRFFSNPAEEISFTIQQASPTSEPSSTTTRVTPDAASQSVHDIVAYFDELTTEVTRLRRETVDQKLKLQTYRVELQRIKESSEKQHKRFQDELRQEKQGKLELQNIIATPHHINGLRKQGLTKSFTQILNDERLFNKAELQKVRNAHASSNSIKADLQRQVVALKQQLDQVVTTNENLRFDLEYLKCTTQPSSPALLENSSIVTAQDEHLPQVPFVLVLVDGDAYSFSEMLPNSHNDSSLHPGTRAAYNIKRCLRAYIIEHSLPPSCKLLVRVLINRAGRTSRAFGHTDLKRYETLRDFMVRFTEFAPLFEFIDAGTGKERVDSKIQELYHTFLPNAECRKIFLATARDNGFARMLEQYIHHPVARQKTCLITAGYTASEIEQLNLETVEWPAVFARRFPPKEFASKMARLNLYRLREENRLKKEREETMKKVGVQGYEEMMERSAFQALTKELVGLKPAGVLVQYIATLDRRRLGINTAMSFRQRMELSSVTEELMDEHDGGICVEVGVD